MTIIVFLIDTSASMCQRTYMGGRPTLLDIAKGAVESFVKVRPARQHSSVAYLRVYLFPPPTHTHTRTTPTRLGAAADFLLPAIASTRGPVAFSSYVLYSFVFFFFFPVRVGEAAIFGKPRRQVHAVNVRRTAGQY